MKSAVDIILSYLYLSISIYLHLVIYIKSILYLSIPILRISLYRSLPMILYLSIYLSIYLSFYISIYQDPCVAVCLDLNLPSQAPRPIHSSIYLFIVPRPTYISIYQSIWAKAYLYICLVPSRPIYVSIPGLLSMPLFRPVPPLVARAVG